MKYWKLTLRNADLGLEEAEYLQYALQHKECCWTERKVYALPASKQNAYNIFALFSTGDRVREDTVVSEVRLTYNVTIIPIGKQPPELPFAVSNVYRVISLEVISEDSYQLASAQSGNMNDCERKPLVYECKEADRDRIPPDRIACPSFSTRFFYKLVRVSPWPPHPDACHCYTCDPAGN
jgi:hypothetical protein